MIRHLIPRLLELAELMLVIAVQYQLIQWLSQREPWRKHRRKMVAGAYVLTAWVALTIVVGTPWIRTVVPQWPAFAWTRAATIACGMCAAGVFVVAAFWRRTPQFDPERRRLLAAAKALTFAAPFAATGYGVFIERNRFRLREVDVPLHGLASDLNGLRLVQLSDIHFGQFLNRTELETIVAMANETKAHLALVTGDLITSRADNLDECIQLVSKLRADAGVLGCLGNHETYADAEDYTAKNAASLGIDFLRRRGRTLSFGAGKLHVAGVDHQPFDQPYLTGTGKLLQSGNGVTNVLLSHNPDVFPVAASQGWDLTLSGHTHGGQITVEILSEHLNPARFLTPYVYGLYQRDRATIYVTRGIGTVGVPARIGAPPEVALLRLCAISS